MRDILGIVGGFGGYATLDFFARVLKKFALESERSYPHIIMDNNFSMPSRTHALLTGEGYEEIVRAIADSMKLLVFRGGTNARYIVLPCATAHCFLPDVYRLVPEANERVVNIVHVLGAALKERGIKRVLVIAAEGALKKHLYRDGLRIYGIDVREPLKTEYTKIRYFIECVKQGKYHADLDEKFYTFLKNYEEQDIILGCTEIPILLQYIAGENNKVSDVYAWRARRFYDPLSAVLDFLHDNMI